MTLTVILFAYTTLFVAPRAHVAHARSAPVRREDGNLNPASDDQIAVVVRASFGDQQLALACANGRGARKEGGGKRLRQYFFAVDPPDQHIRLRTHPATPLPPRTMPNCADRHKADVIGRQLRPLVSPRDRKSTRLNSSH